MIENDPFPSQLGFGCCQGSVFEAKNLNLGGEQQYSMPNVQWTGVCGDEGCKHVHFHSRKQDVRIGTHAKEVASCLNLEIIYSSQTAIENLKRQ